MCVFEWESHVQSMTHCIVIIYCGGQGWCSKVNTVGNKLLGTRFDPLSPALHSVIYSMGEAGGLDS